jgi:hypothetical protein
VLTVLLVDFDHSNSKSLSSYVSLAVVAYDVLEMIRVQGFGRVYHRVSHEVSGLSI